jgi:hypothetical protein
MNRWTALFMVMLLAAFAMMSCSSGDGGPVTPAADQGITSNANHTGQSQTHLWGYYDVTMDLENGTVEAVPNRSAMFAANVVQFLNGNPMGLQFNIISTTPGPSDIGVLINVGITHPLPGLPQYNGYDVRGIFVADGAKSMDYGSGLRYATNGTDQFLNNPDGYTRWFNPSEFRTPGLMGYTPGDFATPGYTGSATLNPYKYYANGLTATSDLWNFLTGTSGNGLFASGATNQRQYDLTFPNTKGVKYGYAIVANWGGEDPEDHPSNAPESVDITVDVTDNIWYEDDENNGGDFILDVNVFNWGDQPSALFLESDLIDGSYEFSESEMVPVGGTGNVSTYHVEVPTTNVTGTEGGEYWIIAEYEGQNYMSDFTPPGGAPSATLAAFYRYGLVIASERYNQDPVCDIEHGYTFPVEAYDEFDLELDATGSYDPDGDPITFHWDFDGDGTFDEDPDDSYTGDPDNPTHTYTEDFTGDVCLLLQDDTDGESECCVSVEITIETSIFYQWYAPDDGAGDLEVLSQGSCAWSYVSSVEAYDENGNSGGYINSCCTILGTPEFDIPSGLPNLHLELIHWGACENYYDGGFLGYTSNGGSTYTFWGPTSPYTDSNLFSFYSGTNCNGPDYCYSLFYNISGCTWFMYPTVPYYPWTGYWFSNSSGWGSSGSPATSDFTINSSLMGTDNIQFAFMFKSDSSVNYYPPGWDIRGIKIYFIP